MKNRGFSIIICTRNRFELLKEAVNSLIPQIKNRKDIELLIVDNNSIDDTSKILTLNSCFNLDNIRLVSEKQIGLSYARNTGARISNFDWVCYMDDDAKANTDFVEVMFYTRENYSFDAFGGMFYPWYISPQPKWLPKEVGTMQEFSKETIVLNKGQFIAGGICAFNKELLFKAGAFPIDVGMRGDIIGYGEENYLQLKIRELGGIIGFNSNWIIYHLVATYKYSLKWNLVRFYSKGRDSNAYLEPLSFLKKIILSFRVILVPPYLLILNTPQMLFNKNYFWQNWVLDSFKYSLRIYGRISSKSNY